MTSYRLGINTCFAVKRWPQPERWARLVRDELRLDLVQHSLDLVDLDASGAADVALILEIIPPFEQDDDQVLDDLRQSVDYWRAGLAEHAGG
jgi:hypothetical protein